MLKKIANLVPVKLRCRVFNAFHRAVKKHIEDGKVITTYYTAAALDKTLRKSDEVVDSVIRFSDKVYTIIDIHKDVSFIRCKFLNSKGMPGIVIFQGYADIKVRDCSSTCMHFEYSHTVHLEALNNVIKYFLKGVSGVVIALNNTDACSRQRPDIEMVRVGWASFHDTYARHVCIGHSVIDMVASSLTVASIVFMHSILLKYDFSGLRIDGHSPTMKFSMLAGTDDTSDQIHKYNTYGLEKAPESSFTMYKAILAMVGGIIHRRVIAKMVVPASAERVLAGQTKIRVSEAVLDSLYDFNGNKVDLEPGETLLSIFDYRESRSDSMAARFEIGKVVVPVSPFDPQEKQCGAGIHGFLNFDDAVAWAHIFY